MADPLRRGEEQIPARTIFRLLTALTALTTITGLAAPASAAPAGNSYVIIDARATAGVTADDLIVQQGGHVTAQYAHARAHVATLTAGQARALRAHGLIVETDQTFTATDTQTPTPSWGLDRIDQTALPLSSSYSYATADQGAGVKAYIIDTGVLKTHQEFTGRLATGFSAFSDSVGSSDCAGHGTHVAGTVAGTRVGIARQATVIPVRVLNCQGSGTSTSITSGVNWVIADHQAGQPAVANLSLGGGASTVLDSLVDQLVADGITVVVAAGNSNVDACTSSPARAASAITVAATAKTDSRASYSNYGTCVDLFAPGGDGSTAGEMIYSAYYTATNAYASMAGTSMASPHVAGAAVRYLSAYPTATPAQVTAALLGSTTANLVTNPGTGTPNKMLYVAPTGYSAPVISTGPLTAPASITATVTGFGQATFTWTPPTSTGGQTLAGYTLAITPLNGGLAQTVTVPATVTSYTATGLTPGVTYTGTVAALTATGAGPSITSNAVTVTGQASAPQNLTATYPKSRVTTLTWTAPASLGGAPLLRYEVRVSTDATGTSWGAWTSVGTSTSATISGITKGSTRITQVRAVTTSGPGQTAQLTIKPTV